MVIPVPLRGPNVALWALPVDARLMSPDTLGLVAPNQAPRRVWWLAACASIGVVAAIGVGAASIELRGGEDPDVGSSETTHAGVAPAESESSTALELSAGPLVTSAAPCPEVEPSLIARATVAFLGTVTVLGEGLVELTVDQAYAGADRETVRVSASRSVDYWLGPVSWEDGGQYLVAAHSGIVLFCGQTGRATSELRAVFDEAFAG